MSSTNPDVDPELLQEAEKLRKLNEKGLKDGEEASKVFEALMKEMAKAGLNMVSAMTGQQQMTLQNQRENLLKEIAASPYFKGLQQKFLATIFPIGGSIMNIAYNLYTAKPPIMNDKQRDELTNIGNSIASLPHKMISGEFDIKRGYDSFISSMNALTKFITNPENVNIAINAGLTLLESVLPIGGFIKSAASDILQSTLSKDKKGGLLRGLGLMAKAYDAFETGLKKVAELKMDEVKSKP